MKLASSRAKTLEEVGLCKLDHSGNVHMTPEGVELQREMRLEAKIMKKVKEAANLLAEEGIEAEVIDLRTVRPIDYDAIISSVKKTNRLVIVEEAWPLASLSSDIAFNVQRDAFDHMDAPVKRVCTADVPMAYAPNLVEEFMPKISKIVEEVKSVMYVKYFLDFK